jgi:hypothetical protein
MASRGSSANLAVGTTLKVRHSPHLINIWLSTTKRSAVDDRDQPANTTVPHAPQTRSSLSFPIGNSKERRVLKSIIDAAGWGLPTVRSLVCVRVTAESLRQERHQIEKPRTSLQGSVIRQHSTSYSGGRTRRAFRRTLLFAATGRGRGYRVRGGSQLPATEPLVLPISGTAVIPDWFCFHDPNVAAPRYRRGRRDNDPPSGGQRFGGGGF